MDFLGFYLGFLFSTSLGEPSQSVLINSIYGSPILLIHFFGLVINKLHLLLSLKLCFTSLVVFAEAVEGLSGGNDGAHASNLSLVLRASGVTKVVVV